MIEKVVRNIYDLLHKQEYGEIVRITNGVRLSILEINQAIIEYGCKLIPYPETIEIDSIEIEGSNPKKWSVVAPVYTQEEGLSDLSIELTVIEKEQTTLEIELDNIHVL